ncbi:unnamed protein product [Trichobilharzia regenti]|nr:unnamed protein product [Trichobilharzia regenti]
MEFIAEVAFMKKVALVTVIGLPGSGKSTLCGHLCKLKMDECFVMWIEYDKLIPSEIFSQNPDQKSVILSFLMLSDSYSYASVVFKCDVDICIRRNCTRMNPVDEHTIHKMAEKFEWPDPVNNLWEKYTILVNSSNEDDVDDAVNFFLKSLSLHTSDPSWRTLYAKSVSKVKLETLRMLHDVLYKEDSVWSIEDCQNLAENLFHEQLSKVFSEELLPDIK